MNHFSSLGGLKNKDSKLYEQLILNYKKFTVQCCAEHFFILFLNVHRDEELFKTSSQGKCVVGKVNHMAVSQKRYFVNLAVPSNENKGHQESKLSLLFTCLKLTDSMLLF